MDRPRPVPVTKNNFSYLMNSDYNTDGDTDIRCAETPRKPKLEETGGAVRVCGEWIWCGGGGGSHPSNAP